MAMSFDKAQLSRELSSLSPRLVAAFAAACAERLRTCFVNAVTVLGRSHAQELEAILDEHWRNLEDDKLDRERILVATERAFALIPKQEDAPLVQMPHFFDAASALVYALRSGLGEGADNAVWAAQCCDDVAGRIAIDLLGVTSGERQLAQVVNAHPTVQAELARQRRDLLELRKNRNNPGLAISSLRDRAKKERIAIPA